MRHASAGAIVYTLEVVGFEPADESRCGCVLPIGCWGDSGWHFGRFGVPELYQMEKKSFARARPGWTIAALRQAWARWLMEEEDAGRFDDAGMHVGWKPYAGLPYAMEPCPAYVAVLAESTNHEQAQRAPRRKFYGPPNANWPKKEVPDGSR